jgi:hypothetical protein
VEDYALIPLRGKFGLGRLAKVSGHRFDELSAYRWRVSYFGYVVRNATGAEKDAGLPHVVTMHRQIMQPPGDMEVDHRNRDTLDNRDENLRVCTTAENRRNSLSFRGKSKYKGIYLHKDTGRWMARLVIDNKTYFLGRYVAEEEAARAYDAAALHHYGAFARTNFPDVMPRSIREIQREVSSKRFNAKEVRMDG